MSKFKQFWFNNIHYPIIVNNFKDWPKERPEKRKDLIHVIEYRAYKAAQKEIEVLKDEVDWRKDSYNELDNINIKLNEQKNTLTAALKVAENAIERIIGIEKFKGGSSAMQQDCERTLAEIQKIKKEEK